MESQVSEVQARGMLWPEHGPAGMTASGPEHSWEVSTPPAPLGHVQSFFLSKLQLPESDFDSPTGRTGIHRGSAAAAELVSGRPFS